jgi:ABC-2 type transport system permease protein/oleandomycin transport system permease protein
MSTRTISAPTRSELSLMFSDWVTLSWRNLIGYLRIPEQVFFSSVQPIMFILLFRYVFGGAIQLDPSLPYTYVDYLMPGIFAQTVAFGAIGTATGLADDLGKGLTERFRSLPMAQSAVLVGRTTADLCRNVFVMALMTGIGFAVGFRIRTNVLSYLAGVGILLLFAYAIGWAFATIGLGAPNGETAQLMVFPILMPLTFASSAFVPVQTMPSWLQAFVRNQPVTVVIDATRALMVGGEAAGPAIKAIAWCIGILVVLGPLAVWRFRRTGVR